MKEDGQSARISSASVISRKIFILKLFSLIKYKNHAMKILYSVIKFGMISKIKVFCLYSIVSVLSACNNEKLAFWTDDWVKDLF